MTGTVARSGLREGVRHRALLVALLLMALQLGSLAVPAYACGCGAMVPSRGSGMRVDEERSVVHWDGRTEQIVMSLTVDGDAPEAAWIMPVPGRATVELGDRALFDELDTLTAPEHRDRPYFWPRDDDWPFAGGESDGAGAPRAGAGGVGVVGRERLGPFDVARLTATDPKALRGWLERNGFELPDALAAELRPYVKQKWEYVAVRLAPEDAEDAALRGTLDPLRMRFPSTELVYPMRLSRLADTPQSLGLYVLAAHRMEPRTAIGGLEPEVLFAGKVEGEGPVGDLTGGDGAFLTAVDQSFPQPERITGDHRFRPAEADTAFRKVVYDPVLWTAGGVPVWLMTFGVPLLVLVVAALLVVRVRGRRPVTPPPPVYVPPPLS
ncbi:DUF2330 domain-containing protein [Streptomyces sp. 21So2-11]|uniref:DUF2330 domain-containing protein n=1 Tax=Streptomyces sp. 21So2-11 TaxID=3144408 RepID=UPI00321ACB07